TNGKTRICPASGSANGSNRRDLCCSCWDYLVRVCSDPSPPVRYVRRPTIRLCESGRLRRPFASTDLLGFYAHNSGQLAPAHHHFTHVGLPKALNRQRAGSSHWLVICRLVGEKVPLFALAAFSSGVTLFTQFRSTGTMAQLPLPWRLNNAAVSCVLYVWQMFWPVRLA